MPAIVLREKSEVYRANKVPGSQINRLRQHQINHGRSLDEFTNPGKLQKNSSPPKDAKDCFSHLPGGGKTVLASSHQGSTLEHLNWNYPGGTSWSMNVPKTEKVVFNIRHLVNLSVNVEAHSTNTNKPRPCHNCKLFDHASYSDHANPKCVKGWGNHQALDWKNRADKAPKCANCGGWAPSILPRMQTESSKQTQTNQNA